jgi:hypothetical protein
MDCIATDAAEPRIVVRRVPGMAARSLASIDQKFRLIWIDRIAVDPMQGPGLALARVKGRGAPWSDPGWILPHTKSSTSPARSH